MPHPEAPDGDSPFASNCPVCLGRYPGDHVDVVLMKIRAGAADEAIADAREDLAKALGLDPADLDSFESLLRQVRDLAAAPAPARPKRGPSAEALAAAREEGRQGGLHEAHELIVQVAEGLAVDASEASSIADRVIRSLMVVAGQLRGLATKAAK